MLFHCVDICRTIYLFIHQLMDIHVVSVLAIMNNADRNIYEQGCAWIHVFISLGYVSRTGISHHMETLFKLLRNCQGCFLKWLHHWHSHQQCMRVPISLICFLILTILVGMKWYFIVVYICISLMANDVENLFMCLLAICISLEKCLYRFFAYF